MSTRDAITAVEGSAYWFMTGGKITFIWKLTGTVEVWTPDSGPDAKGYSSMINGVTPGTLSRGI